MNKLETIHYRKNSLLRNLVHQLQALSQSKQYPNKFGLITNEVNPQQLRSSIKLSKSWKATGTTGQQFGGINVLRNKMLKQWQIQRMPLAKRSYSCPKNFKGLKLDHHSRQFGTKSSKVLHSKKFSNYLKEMEEKYQNNLFRPNYHQKVRYEEKKTQMGNDKFKFTTSSNFFGAAKETIKLGSLKSYKSQLLSKESKFK